MPDLLGTLRIAPLPSARVAFAPEAGQTAAPAVSRLGSIEAPAEQPDTDELEP